MHNRKIWSSNLRAETSDWREASKAASSYADVAGWYSIGCVCGGVNSGTVFSVRGGNSTPAACKTKWTNSSNITVRPKDLAAPANMQGRKHKITQSWLTWIFASKWDDKTHK